MLKYPRYPLLHSISGSSRILYHRRVTVPPQRANRLPLWQHICLHIVTEKYKTVKILKARFRIYGNALCWLNENTSPVVTWRRKLLVRFSFSFLREAQFPPQRDFTLLLYHTQAVFKNFCLKIYAKLFAFLY